MEKKRKAKEAVRLREKKLAHGNRSLYLDCYDKGVRTYRYLRLYLVPEVNEAAKKKNKITMARAIKIKDRANRDFENNIYYSELQKAKSYPRDKVLTHFAPQNDKSGSEECR